MPVRRAPTMLLARTVNYRPSGHARIRRHGLGQVVGGGCVQNGDGTCVTPFGNVACAEVRECDSITGAVHFEYALPGGNANADINVVDPNTGTVIGYNDATGVAASSGPIAFGTQIVNPQTGQLISPASSAAVVSQSNAPNPSVVTTPSGGSSQSNAPAAAAVVPASGSGSFLTSASPLFGLPWWMVIAGAGGALFFFGGKQ